MLKILFWLTILAILAFLVFCLVKFPVQTVMILGKVGKVLFKGVSFLVKGLNRCFTFVGNGVSNFMNKRKEKRKERVLKNSKHSRNQSNDCLDDYSNNSTVYSAEPSKVVNVEVKDSNVFINEDKF